MSQTVEHRPMHRSDRRTEHQTFSWIDRAAVLGLAKFVGQPKEDLPVQVVLDEQLTVDSEHPNMWVKPTQDRVGPLRDRVEDDDDLNRGWRDRKNAFFNAVRKWRPTLSRGVGALSLDTKFRLEYILDKNNNNAYVQTVLHLTDGDDGLVPGALLRRPQPPRRFAPEEGDQSHRDGPTRDEDGPHRGRGPMRGPPRGDRPPRDDRGPLRGPPRGDRPPREDRGPLRGPPRGDRPPREDHGRLGGPPRGDRPPRDDRPPQDDRPPRDDAPHRGDGPFRGRGGPRGGRGRGRGRGRGGPLPPLESA